METEQLWHWKSDFGDQYNERNRKHISDDVITRLMHDWGLMLRSCIAPKPKSALEVGCNLGRNILALRNFIQEIHAVDPNEAAVAEAKANPGLVNCDIRVGDCFDLPYPDNSIDLVFTSGVLMLVEPENLKRAIDEICRVARHYVICIEYFSHEPIEVAYRGLPRALFKRDFGSFYLDNRPDLDVLDYGFLWKRINCADNSNWWLFKKNK